jgi:hypothetical protein
LLAIIVFLFSSSPSLPAFCSHWVNTYVAGHRDSPLRGHFRYVMSRR